MTNEEYYKEKGYKLFFCCLKDKEGHTEFVVYAYDQDKALSDNGLVKLDEFNILPEQAALFAWLKTEHASEKNN